MGVFLYYLPGLQVGTVTREHLRAAGLEMPFRDCLVSQLAFQERVFINQVHANGPDRSSGVVLFMQPFGMEVAQDVRYLPQSQVWEAIDGGKYWLGHDPGHLPDPASLAREDLIRGADVQLGDERSWHVPLIRRCATLSTLPAAYGCDATGEFRRRPLPAWEWAWNLSQEVFDVAFSGHQEMKQSDAFRLAVGCLSVNYRLGMQEASRLGLINDLNFQKVFDVVIDWEKVKELVGESAEETGDPDKKKEDDPPLPASSSGGPGGGSPITSPVAAISTC